MRRGWFVTWVVLLVLQLWILYNPDGGAGPGFLSPLWDVTRSWPGPTAPGEPGFDKIVHATSFALVAATGLLARLPTWFAIGLPLVHAPVSEIVQWAWVPGRSGDPRDAAADITGILVAWAVVALARRLSERRSRGRREGRVDGIDEDGAGARQHQAGPVPEAGGAGRGRGTRP